MEKLKNRPGEYYELKHGDIGRNMIWAWSRAWAVSEFIGVIGEQDVGKRVYRRGADRDVLQVENDEQRNRRSSSSA